MKEIKILIVDDELDTLAQLKKHLQRFLACSIYESSSGQDAIEKMKTDDFDLVILDIKMPEINGIDVMREVSKTKALPDILVVTAWDSTEVADEVIRVGALDYIPKPVSLEMVFEKVKAILKKKDRYVEKK